mgnify:CR=1 FL=1
MRYECIITLRYVKIIIMMTTRQRQHWKNYCSEPLELVENYKQAEADGFEGWCMHHRLEIQPDGTRVSAKELIDKKLYWKRPASELIFMRFGEHSTLHNAGKNHPFFGKIGAFTGKHHTNETRQKMSVNNGRFWKGKTMSEETRQKISNTLKGRIFSEETRKKIALVKRGNHNVKGLHWWNNGISNKYCRECPGEEWKRGRV